MYRRINTKWNYANPGRSIFGEKACRNNKAFTRSLPGTDFIYIEIDMSQDDHRNKINCMIDSNKEGNSCIDLSRNSAILRKENRAPGTRNINWHTEYG